MCTNSRTGVKQVNVFEWDDIGPFSQIGPDFINALNMRRLFYQENKYSSTKMDKALIRYPSSEYWKIYYQFLL